MENGTDISSKLLGLWEEITKGPQYLHHILKLNALKAQWQTCNAAFEAWEDLRAELLFFGDVSDLEHSVRQDEHDQLGLRYVDASLSQVLTPRVTPRDSATVNHELLELDHVTKTIAPSCRISVIVENMQISASN